MKYNIINADVLDGLAQLPDKSVQCVVTSPPYWALRDYGVDGQIGLEETPDEYINKMVNVFRAVRRVLRDDGTMWVNIGDSYAQANARGATSNSAHNMPGPRLFRSGTHTETSTVSALRASVKPKDLVGMPWRLAFALRADGWYLRSDTIWSKPNPMPESARDRPTKAHEYIFLLSKRARYFYDAEAVREASSYGRDVDPDKFKACGTATRNPRRKTQPSIAIDPSAGRSARTVWEIPAQKYEEAHFATYPEELVRRCVAAGTSEKGSCPECGAPWQRITERDRQPTRPGISNKSDDTGLANRDELRHVTKVTTTGWQPSCDCLRGGFVQNGTPMKHISGDDFEPMPLKPCTVLDPFAGSGTTLAVACKMDRHAIGIEINPEYCKLAEERISKALRPNTYRSDKDDGPTLWTMPHTGAATNNQP